MVRQVVVGDLRVQPIHRKDGRRSWTIVWPEGTEHPEADRFLRVHDGSGTQRTYAYLLVDHLRWLERECLTFDAVGLRDLERYMGILGAEVRMPLGEPWRVGKRPYGRSALSTTAACLKGFYLHQASLGVNTELGQWLDKTRLPSRADRRRAAGAREDGDACESAGAEEPVSTAPEDAPGRRTKVNGRHRELGEGPGDRVLAGRRGSADRRVVRSLPG
ncbi:hypothetical protein AB0L41_42300 [Amycolatopsis mediterranei]|uniref:hypothetical protein n=1 Tax=Amycolatopsis mediterranei TaxID=33910 RepID=UPI00342DF31C